MDKNTHPVHHAPLINLIDILRIASSILSFFFCFHSKENIPNKKKRERKKKDKSVSQCVCMWRAWNTIQLHSVAFFPPQRAIILPPPPKKKKPGTHTHTHTSMTRRFRTPLASHPFPSPPWSRPCCLRMGIVRRVNNMMSFPDVTRGSTTQCKGVKGSLVYWSLVMGLRWWYVCVCVQRKGDSIRTVAPCKADPYCVISLSLARWDTSIYSPSLYSRLFLFHQSWIGIVRPSFP